MDNQRRTSIRDGRGGNRLIGGRGVRGCRAGEGARSSERHVHGTAYSGPDPISLGPSRERPTRRRSHDRETTPDPTHTPHVSQCPEIGVIVATVKGRVSVRGTLLPHPPHGYDVQGLRPRVRSSSSHAWRPGYSARRSSYSGQYTGLSGRKPSTMWHICEYRA